jgi:TRAP-type C4-dicarboxylate transport system substrate-binding protein
VRSIILTALALALSEAPGAGRVEGAAPAQQQTVKLGTLAPEQTAWYNILRDMTEEWKKATDGKVRFRIYPGGVLGDEPDMVNKLGINQLQAAALTGVGLAEISPEIFALMMPLLIRSYEELDYVLEKVGPSFEAMLKKKGYTVLHWADAGWVTFFAQRPVVSLDDLRKTKLFVWSSGTVEVEVWKDFGVPVVPLPATEIHPALKSGLINAFSTTPLAALSFQWFGSAKNMTGMRWAPLVGATVIRNDAWDKIPAAVQPALLKSAQVTGERFKKETRKLGDDAIAKMKEYGLTVHPVPPAVLEEWEKTVRSAYPRIMGKNIPPAIVAEVEKVRDEFRASKK